ncbi:MAG TPA: DUF4976 domain-containing protein, partial [Candidatus Hydrogenedentes bacterium]|nr:DUF4976 domain-containing protein [Candidatus Hydrogenedentota bacterium]
QQRADTLACYGNSAVQTPHLDALAARGALFESCYATQPVCSPCRSSMVTGLFPNATTVVDNNLPLPASLFSWPRALHDAGYRTAYIGKWHLGVEPVPDYFDVWRGFQTGWKHWIREEPFYAEPGESDSLFRERIKQTPPVVSKDESLIGKYRPDIETDYALAFMKENKERPFACWLSFYPPHTPKEAPEENVALYKGGIEPREQAIYHAMVNRLDWNIGRVMAGLDKLGLRESTLVVFTSDHGENFPWRWNNHHKRLCYDQSANVPLIMSWPGVLPEGKRVETVVSTADLCPSIVDLCNMPVPNGLHGESMKQLLGGDIGAWRKEAFIQNNPYRSWVEKTEDEDPHMRERCVVTDSWKLILNTTRRPELYNRRTDRNDMNNVFEMPENKGVVRDMVRRMHGWARKTEDEIALRLIEKWFSIG